MYKGTEYYKLTGLWSLSSFPNLIKSELCFYKINAHTNFLKSLNFIHKHCLKPQDLKLHPTSSDTLQSQPRGNSLEQTDQAPKRKFHLTTWDKKASSQAQGFTWLNIFAYQKEGYEYQNRSSLALQKLQSPAESKSCKGKNSNAMPRPLGLGGLVCEEQEYHCLPHLDHSLNFSWSYIYVRTFVCGTNKHILGCV